MGNRQEEEALDALDAPQVHHVYFFSSRKDKIILE